MEAKSLRDKKCQDKKCWKNRIFKKIFVARSDVELGPGCSIWQFCPIWLEMLKLGKLYITHNQIPDQIHSISSDLRQMVTSKSSKLLPFFVEPRRMGWYFNKGPVVWQWLSNPGLIYIPSEKSSGWNMGLSLPPPPRPRLQMTTKYSFRWIQTTA